MNRLNIALITLAAMLIAQPAWGFLDEAWNTVWKPVDELGDWVEEETGIDLDWADDIDHVLGEAGDIIDGGVEEFCKILGLEKGKNCHVSGGVTVADDGSVGLTDGRGNPPEVPEPEDATPLSEDFILIGQEVIKFDDTDLNFDLDSFREALLRWALPDFADIDDVLLESPRFASVNITVPSYVGHPGGQVTGAVDRGGLLRVAFDQLNLGHLTREQRKLGFALDRYASTVAKGDRAGVYAWFVNQRLVAVKRVGQPLLLPGGAKSMGPFYIRGTDLLKATEKGYLCDDLSLTCAPPGEFRLGPVCTPPRDA